MRQKRARRDGSKMQKIAWIAAASALACSGALSPDNPQSLEALAPPAATVVLVHGMGSFSVGPVDYFYRVPQLYRALGASVVVPELSMFASVESRAAALQQQLDAVPGPLILLAHSQGGLDARWLVSKLGYAGRVRAVVTIATPHHGSPVADLALGLVPGPVQSAVDAIVGVLGWSLEGAREVTVQNMEQVFNPGVPDMPGVAYWSYSGHAAPLGIGAGWLHAPLLATWTFLEADAGANDGMVPEASAHWGRFMGQLPADHMGEVDQPLGEVPDFDAPGFYRRLLRRFHDEGW
jgi:triacylglycerol lipase